VYDRPAVTLDPLLHAAVRAVARGSDAERALDELLLIAMRLSGSTAAAAMLWDAAQGALVVAGSRGLEGDGLAALTSAAAKTGDPVHRAAHDRIRVIDAASTTGTEERTSAWPIVVTRDGVEEPVGALALVTDGPLDTAAIDSLAAVADLIGLLVDRLRLAEDAAERADWQERVAHSDALTGLADARTLLRVVELEIVRAARQRTELCVAVFDVDDLTKINAEAGRAAGDDILREVAAVATESTRLVDTMARWGGDEFILIAPGATGTAVVKRIVESVAGRPPIAGRTFTVSAGLARFPADGTTGDALIESATAALRAAQAMGPGTLAESVPGA
jgi:diguanylate cyclase (GGDEF)-like protein